MGHPDQPDTPNSKVGGLQQEPPLTPNRLKVRRFPPLSKHVDAVGNIHCCLGHHRIGALPERPVNVDIRIEHEHGHPCLFRLYDAITMDEKIHKGESSSSY